MGLSERDDQLTQRGAAAEAIKRVQCDHGAAVRCRGNGIDPRRREIVDHPFERLQLGIQPLLAAADDPCLDHRFGDLAPVGRPAAPVDEAGSRVDEVHVAEGGVVHRRIERGRQPVHRQTGPLGQVQRVGDRGRIVLTLGPKQFDGDRVRGPRRRRRSRRWAPGRGVVDHLDVVDVRHAVAATAEKDPHRALAPDLAGGVFSAVDAFPVGAGGQADGVDGRAVGQPEGLPSRPVGRPLALGPRRVAQPDPHPDCRGFAGGRLPSFEEGGLDARARIEKRLGAFTPAQTPVPGDGGIARQAGLDLRQAGLRLIGRQVITVDKRTANAVPVQRLILAPQAEGAAQVVAAGKGRAAADAIVV